MKTRDDIPHARKAADLAAQRGMRLAHQCHTTSLFEQVEPMLAVLRDIDRENFGLVYEPANLMLNHEPYGIETLQKLKPHLYNVYVQNHELDPNGPVELETWCQGMQRFHHIPFWETGGVVFEEVMAGLQAIGYDGYFTVHQAYGEIMGPQEAAVESYKYLTSLAEFE
jgi:sugar phosphate isomerase/epimerase